MAIRLKPMRDLLKDTGSIYLHCNPAAGHYLKMIMDVIFGKKNFRNEIIWYYNSGPRGKKDFGKRHDYLFRYSKTDDYYVDFECDEARTPYSPDINIPASKAHYYHPKGKVHDDVWKIPIIAQNDRTERLGYRTQKPLSLLKRVIATSSNRGDLVLDPFCGCGTTLHSAEELNRQWVGIDISQFATGLVTNRLFNNIPNLERSDITVIGCPLNLVDAQDLARNDPFEFEKWACGEVGAQGLFHNPGDRGADGGVDGVIPFHYSEHLFDGKPPEKTFAVVQVKGGKVTPDSVKALSTTVRESGGKCGIMICFEKYMNTVENNREKKLIKEMSRDFNFIQGLSIENLIEGKRPYLPLQGYAA